MAGESLSWRSAWEALSQKTKALRYEVYKTDKILLSHSTLQLLVPGIADEGALTCDYKLVVK